MLQLEHIDKVFFRNTPDERWALRNLSCTVQPDEFVTIVGSNGAGKTTLLNIVSGNHFPDRGRVIIEDHDVTSLPAFRRARFIGRVFQNTTQGTAASLTIEENFAIAYAKGRTRGLRLAISEHLRKKIREKLAEVGLGLENRLRDRVGLLSGGQRQALALLMATIGNPKILLLDEHTANLDPKTAEKIMNLTNLLIRDDHLTAFMITHDLGDALKYGTRTILMDDGGIVLDISGEERKKMTINELLERFSERRHKKFANDRVLLSTETKEG
ncbi:MAG: ATP-binding cassette domain-containing protein [Atribacterota bacterium]|nr:ATP-binding cassette domain-containing protein [Atribacterota bacterium]HHT09423.1 ATP-binding cassette domain-containing protein [Candidatus Atribacteria bacterium]